MLKNARLYKRNENGYIWHVKSDGTAMQYPTFTHHDTKAKGVYKEVSLLNTCSIPVSDCLYLAVLDNEKTTLVVAEATYKASYETTYKASCFDIFTGDCITGNFTLFPVPNLICGHEYVVNGDVMTLDHYDDEIKTFVFLSDNTELGACVKIAQICDVKEVPKMPKMYEIWKDENGEAHGRDCETGRTFVISEETFERVEYCAKKPRVGDIVYINNLTGVKPYEVTFVQNIAKRLNDDLLMLRYAYGYYPNFDTRDQNQRLWKVLYVGTAHSLIEEHSTGTRSMICVCDNDSLTVSENQKDDEPF